MAIDFTAEARAMRDELIARRRDLHRHPELAFEEVRTAGIVAAELAALGLEVRTGVAGTGVVGLLEGEHEGPTVLVRADMDALPVHEENTTEYVSTMPGKMHACGHDGHTAVALAVARLFAQRRAALAGRIKFVFQPAEETGQGAAAMVRDGVLEDPRPDVALGLHLWNGMPLGMVGIADGPVMAGSSDLLIRIQGRGAHAAQPHLAVDPIICAAQIIMALQTIVSRNVRPLDSAVISIARVLSGTTHNVIPQDAELLGTVRTFRPEVRELVERRLHEVCSSIGQAMGCTTEVSLSHSTEPVANHPEVAGRLRALFREMVGPDCILTEEQRTMGAEDFGALLDGVPGAFFFVGSANAARGLDYGHHHPRFDFDEDALPLSVALMAAAVAEYVLPEQL